MNALSGVTGLGILAEEWSHPARQGQHYQMLREEATDWFLSFNPFSDPTRIELLVKSDYPLLVTLAWPDADRDRARDLCALTATLATWDDEADDELDQDRAAAVTAELQS